MNATEKGINKNTGRYQGSLYWHFISAKKEKDEGYFHDVLEKIIILQNEIEEIKVLMKNKKFMKEWRRNMGQISPLQLIKHTGNMRQVNYIKSLI